MLSLINSAWLKPNVRRIKLSFVPGLDVEFVDRDVGLGQVMEWAEKSTRFPVVIFGPEGCGKTAFLKQAAEVLRELGYEVFYIHPLDEVFEAKVSFPDVKRAFMEFVERALADNAVGRIVWAVFEFTRKILSIRRSNVAVVVDDAFQVIGLDKAAGYVKGLLNMIEHPVYDYEKMVVLVATSEGLSREEIGRHFWAEITPMWNMPGEGFEQLYEKLPGPKPPFEDVWRLTGGNPRMLARLYQAGWRADHVINRIIDEKGLTRDFIARWRGWLERVVEDPDAASEVDFPGELRSELVKRNLIIYNMYFREPNLWIDYIPPERDLDLGIGRYAAWQTPLHREAVRRVLKEVSA